MSVRETGVDVETRCEHIPYKVYDGLRQGQTWLSDDELLALITRDGESMTDCGRVLQTTDQETPFLEVGGKTGVNRSRRDTGRSPMQLPPLW